MKSLSVKCSAGGCRGLDGREGNLYESETERLGGEVSKMRVQITTVLLSQYFYASVVVKA
jgi:hypothetical protein